MLVLHEMPPIAGDSQESNQLSNLLCYLQNLFILFFSFSVFLEPSGTALSPLFFFVLK